MQVLGRVVEVENNIAYVTLLRTSACGGNCKACGGSCESTQHTIQTLNSIDAKVGEIVEVFMDDKTGLKASAILYLIPLLGFTLFIFLGYILELKDTWTFLLGIFGMFFSYLIVHFIDKKNRKVNPIKILPFNGI